MAGPAMKKVLLVLVLAVVAVACVGGGGEDDAPPAEPQGEAEQAVEGGNCNVETGEPGPGEGVFNADLECISQEGDGETAPQPTEAEQEPSETAFIGVADEAEIAEMDCAEVLEEQGQIADARVEYVAAIADEGVSVTVDDDALLARLQDLNLATVDRMEDV